MAQLPQSRPGACQGRVLSPSFTRAHSGGAGSADLVLECGGFEPESLVNTEVTTECILWPQLLPGLPQQEPVCPHSALQIRGLERHLASVVARLTLTGRTRGGKGWHERNPENAAAQGASQVLSSRLPSAKPASPTFRTRLRIKNQKLTHSPFDVFSVVFPTCWNSF